MDRSGGAGPRLTGALGLAILLVGSAIPAQASPWAEVGDVQLRSDIQLLAAAGVVDGITSQWPLPWPGLLKALRRHHALDGQPESVRAAAARVEAAAQAQLPTNGAKLSAYADLTNQPNVVRGFGGMGRDAAQAQVSLETLLTPTTALRINAGALYSDWSHGHGKLMMDGSYIAQKIGGAVLYAGYLDQWWGPGWISALSLSNNARPFPQVGIERLSTAPFESPWLSWIGPWQAQFLVGLLDGPRIDEDTWYSGLRISFNPLPGLEIALSRTEEFCGDHHPCNPIANYFDFRNDPTHVNKTNDQGTIDIHYTGMAWGTAYEVYTQMMNEDSNPITHSGTSHLFGASVWLPLAGNTTRITAEYTDSIATRNIFSFGNVFHGFAYNNGGYPDGMRYRGRTLGFSLDSDSRLASLQASWREDNGWAWTVSYHHAWISTPQNASGNVVTTAPVTINLGEARLTVPMKWGSLEFAGRLQDDQPRPDHGFEGAFEVAFRVGL